MNGLAGGPRSEPLIEVEFQTHALELAAEGAGDSRVSYHVGRSLSESRGVFWAPLDPPIVERYAFVTRRNASTSPSTREFSRVARKVLQRIGAKS